MAPAQTPLYVGIDLGTTNSAAAVFDGDQVAVVRNAAGGTVTPSVVRIDKQGRITVGARARKMMESDPQNTASEWKRLMGTNATVEFAATAQHKSPEEVSAEVLKAIRADIADQTGVMVERAVISVPALFELPQSTATSEAARLAGFSQVELLQEPIASALAAGWRADHDGAQSWLVFDLGGGTFDASLLETRDGLLRVVGHDGDNFLGGRDFDWAITEHLAKQLSVPLSRREPGHKTALRMLRLAVEDAKIELSRQAQAAVTLSTPLRVDGVDVPVDLELDRGQLETLCTPLVDRAIDVCLRLIAKHGLTASQLAKVVLVGGPTVMPFLRTRVQARLQVAFAEGHDPMTLVAQGAAIYAATTGLNGRVKAADNASALVPTAAAAASTAATTAWLQYPAVSADLTPHVVGRFLGAALPTTMTLHRTDGQWQSPPTTVAADGAFITTTSLLPHKVSSFRIVASDPHGRQLPVAPSEFSIVHGLTIGDPPLSRTVGVALANDHVHVYLERGTPLPARRTFTHHTVQTVAKGESSSLLSVPIVQGELSQAHLCRLIGKLDIVGTKLADTVPAGTPVEVTIELNRGGQLAAKAFIPGLDQVFEHVAHLLVPKADPASLDASAARLLAQLHDVRAFVVKNGLSKAIAKLANMERALADAYRDIDAAHGGDVDAAQRATRALIEVDSILEEVELEKQWPELLERARYLEITGAATMASYGTASERQLFDEVMAAAAQARKQRDPAELERQLQLLNRLAAAALHRSDEVWVDYFDQAAGLVAEARDVPAAQRYVTEGKQAIAAQKFDKLREIVRGLWNLLPEDPKQRAKAFDSGVR